MCWTESKTCVCYQQSYITVDCLVLPPNVWLLWTYLGAVSRTVAVRFLRWYRNTKKSVQVGKYKMTSSVYPISSLLSILAVVRLRNGPSVSSWIAFQANPIMAKAHLTRKSALYSCLPSEPVRTHFSIYSLVYCTLNFLLHLTFTSPCLRRQALLFSFSLLVILDCMHFLVSSLVVQDI